MAAAGRAAASLLAADRRAAASLLAADQRAAASLLAADFSAANSLLAAHRSSANSLLLAAHRRAANSLLLAADREEASSLLRAANCLLLAAHRSADNSLLLTADREEASSLLRAATSLLLRPAAASMFGPVPPSTVAPQLLLTDGRTSILAQRAVLCDPLSSQAQIRSADTTTPLTGCTSTIQIAADSYTSRPTAAILGRRALFSVPSLPRATTRNPVSALASAAGSMLSRRGMATEATESITPEVQQAVGLLNQAKQRLTPEVKCAIGLIEAANAASHEEYMKELREFEVEIINIYSAGGLASAETALTAGKVAWRVHTAVLAFGVTTLVAVLQMVKGGWKSDFERDIEEMVKKMMAHIKSELLATVREIVMSELKVIDAEKVVKK